MKTSTKITIIIAAAGVLVAFIFLMLKETTMKYGMMLIGGCVLAYLIWRAFIKTGREELKRSERRSGELEDEVARLKKTVAQLDRELAEKSRTKLNVVELNPILHIAVLDVDTSFVRPYVREEGKLEFNGALRADICAEYGIKLEDVRFKYDELSNTLKMTNFHPGILSFSKKRLTWEFAKTTRSRSLFGRNLSAVQDSEAEAFTKRKCEELRTELEKEIDERQIQEFTWLSPLIKGQVTDLMRLLVGRQSVNIEITDAQDDSFIDITTLRNQLESPGEQPEELLAIPSASSIEITKESQA